MWFQFKSGWGEIKCISCHASSDSKVACSIAHKLSRCGPQWLAIGGSHFQARVGDWTRTARTAHRQQPIRQHKVAIERSGQGSLSDGHGPFCTFLCYHTLQIDNTYPRCPRARRYESSLKSGGESGWTAFKFVLTTTPLIRWSIYGTQITHQYEHISDICATPFLHSCHFQPASINITQQKPRPQSADSPTSSKLNFAVISHISIWPTGTETLKEKFQQGESHVEILNDRWKLILRRVCSSVYVT